MAKRKINIIGDIDNEAYLLFVEQMDALEKGTGDIEIELSSDGGDAYSALAFFDRIRRSQCDIIIIAHGLVASAAVIILAAGDYRQITANSWVMVHEDTVPFNEDARVTEVEKDVAHSRRLEIQWCELLEKVTGTPQDTWASLHKAETYLTPEDCLRLNLVETIV